MNPLTVQPREVNQEDESNPVDLAKTEDGLLCYKCRNNYLKDHGPSEWLCADCGYVTEYSPTTHSIRRWAQRTDATGLVASDIREAYSRGTHIDGDDLCNIDANEASVDPETDMFLIRRSYVIATVYTINGSKWEVRAAVDEFTDMDVTTRDVPNDFDSSDFSDYERK